MSRGLPEPDSEPTAQSVPLQCPHCFNIADEVLGDQLYCSFCGLWVTYYQAEPEPASEPLPEQDPDTYGRIRARAMHPFLALLPRCSCSFVLKIDPVLSSIVAIHKFAGRTRSRSRRFDIGNEESATQALASCVNFLWHQHYALGHCGQQPTLDECRESARVVLLELDTD